MPLSWPGHPWIVLGALAVEAVIGYPSWLHRAVPHPVVWAGTLIGALEQRWNLPTLSPLVRRLNGVATALIVVGLAMALGLVIEWAPFPAWLSIAAVVLVGTVGLAQRSLYEHVAAVDRALSAGDLALARSAVGRIVGRDTAHLDEAGVATAALESLAESFNDAVMAPAFWFAVAGLPGLFAYKAANTADSQIGHKEERWRMFGWAAAWLDDVMNLIPARLAGGLIAAVGGGGWRVMLRDAPKHASPNAGWPEAALAGALGIRFGGAVAYDGVVTERPTFGDGRAPTPADLRRGLKIYVRACGLFWLLLALGGLAWPR